MNHVLMGNTVSGFFECIDGKAPRTLIHASPLTGPMTQRAPGIAFVPCADDLWSYDINHSSLASMNLAGFGVTKAMLDWNLNIVVNNGSLYFSSDNGATWSGPFNPGISITHFALMGTWIFAGTAADGIYRSKDGGLTWENVKAFAYPVTAMSADNNYIFATTITTEILISDDGGDTWTDLGVGLGLYVLDIWFRGQNIVIATSGGGCYWSINQGALFTRQVLGAFYPQIGQQLFDDGASLWCASQQGLFRSFDYGPNWMLIDLNDQSDYLGMFTWDDGIAPPTPGGSSSSGSSPAALHRMRLKPFTKRVRASDYRFKAMLQEQLLKSDGMGGNSQHWDDIAPLWVDIKPMSAHEIIQASLAGTVVDTRIMMRDPGDLTLKIAADGKITRKLRLVYGTHIYKISGIIDRGDTVEVICEEMQPSDEHA